MLKSNVFMFPLTSLNPQFQLNFSFASSCKVFENETIENLISCQSIFRCRVQIQFLDITFSRFVLNLELDPAENHERAHVQNSHSLVHMYVCEVTK